MKLEGVILSVLMFSLMITSVVITGCLETGKDEELNVIAVSILPQKEIVEAISGDDIKVIVMVPDGQDPHGYSPTPGQLTDLVEADVYFKVGSGVEFEVVNMDILEETNPDMKVVDLSEGIDVISFDEHHGASDHDHDDNEEVHEEEDDHDHDGTDPHIWLSPNNMKIMADNILEALIGEDPDNENVYISNHANYISEIDSMISFIEDRLEPFEEKEFLVYHPAWGYFADDFNLVQLSVEEEGKSPGPQGIAAIIDQAREHNITVVFMSPQFDSSSAKQIADEIGGEVVKVDPLAGNYMENLRSVARSMEEGFS